MVVRRTAMQFTQTLTAGMLMKYVYILRVPQEIKTAIYGSIFCCSKRN